MQSKKVSQKKKKGTALIGKILGMLIGMLIGFFCGFLMMEHIKKFGSDMPLYRKILSLIGLFIGMYFIIFFHIIIHETGHLIFGLLTGYKFSSFRIFSFMWLMENGKIKLKQLNVAGTGGQCLMLPPDTKNGNTPYILYNLGGSFANIIASAILLIGYLLCFDIPFLSLFFLMGSISGLMLAAMNGIPMRLGAVDNDGYNVLSISKSAEAMEAFLLQLKITGQNAKGIRLKDMPSEWFKIPSDEAMRNSMVAVQGVFCCNRLMDNEDFEAADRLMAYMLEIDSGIPNLYRNLLICDRIYVELIGENRQEVIESMLSKEQKKFMKSMERFPSVLRTEYTLALFFIRDTSKAKLIQLQFEKIAKSYPYPHEIQSERDLMHIADHKMKLDNNSC